MSKQLAISAAFSVFAMAAFVLSATSGQMPTGAQTEIHAPVGFSIHAAIAD